MDWLHYNTMHSFDLMEILTAPGRKHYPSGRVNMTFRIIRVVHLSLNFNKIRVR